MKEPERKQFDIIIGASGVRKTERRGQRVKQGSVFNWDILALYGNIGVSIVLPLVGGAFLGSYLDKLWQTYPRGTLILIALGFGLSLLILVRALRSFIEAKKL